MVLSVFISTAISLISVVVFIRLIIPLAKRLKLVDNPGGRKHHLSQTPLIGGLAMFLAFCLGTLCLPISLQPFRPFFAAAFLLVFIGILDDFHELTPRFRLFVQIVAGLIMVMWGRLVLNNLGNLIFIHDVHLNYGMELIISVCAVIGIINAINMLDGVDGLVGTITLVQFLFLIYLAFSKGYLTHISLIILFVPVILGFLYFNFPFPWRRQAFVFMGDAGSMFLGFGLVWFSIYLSQPPHRAASPAVFLWIMAVPLFDIGSSMLRRILRGNSPFKPDRGHIHHLLLQLKCSSLTIVLILSTATIIFSLIGIMAQHFQVRSALIFIIFVSVFVIYMILTEAIWCKLERQNKSS